MPIRWASDTVSDSKIRSEKKNEEEGKSSASEMDENPGSGLSAPAIRRRNRSVHYTTRSAVCQAAQTAKLLDRQGLAGQSQL